MGNGVTDGEFKSKPRIVPHRGGQLRAITDSAERQRQANQSISEEQLENKTDHLHTAALQKIRLKQILGHSVKTAPDVEVTTTTVDDDLG